MELNREIDAIIISKIAERKDISKIDSNAVLLNCLSSIGLISSQLKKNQSPVGYLSPLFVNVTLLARKANVDLGAILDQEEYNSKLNYSNAKIAVANLSRSIIELNFIALNFAQLDMFSKDEIKDLQMEALKESYFILKNINLLAILHNSEIERVQKHVVKHINQLVKII